jgi:dihydropteroate synthase
LQHRTGVLPLRHPVVMGILNVTPDSFSDGGRYLDLSAAIAHAHQMLSDGATIIDVGGESTRPGAEPLSVQAELDRVLPVIERLAIDPKILISVDTSRTEVIGAAARAGAQLLNDVRALQLPGAMQAAARSGMGICLMHLQGEPASMQGAPQYTDVVGEVVGFLRLRVQAALNAGIAAERLCVDPGIGFGKTIGHNLELLRHLDALSVLKLPVLVGCSRKRLLQELTGREVGQRQAGSLALATSAVLQGASIIRAHDVAATLDVVRVAAALREPRDT